MLPMTTFFLRIFPLYHLLNSLLFHLIPKRISSLLPTSWNPNTHQPNPQNTTHQPNSQDSSLSSSIPRTDMSELRRVFQMFDRNGDGRITKQELCDSLENMGIFIPEKELEAMIEKIDANGDGCIDIGEFHNLYQMIMDERDEEEDMKEAFDIFDQNGDGLITVEELRSVLVSLGLKHGKTEEDCKKMISKVDVDGDGMVDFKEFKQMMRGGGFAALSSSSCS